MGIDRHRKRRRGRAGHPGAGRRGRQFVAAVGQGHGGEAPGPAGVRRRRPNLRRTVQYLHQAIRCRHPGQGQGVVIGDAIARHSAVGRERGDLGCGRGRHRRRDGDGKRRRRRPGVAGDIHRLRREAVAAACQRRRGVTPGSGTVRYRSADLVSPIRHLHRTVRLGCPGQDKGIVAGDAVAHDTSIV